MLRNEKCCGRAIQNMLKNGAYLINAAQVKQLEDVVLVWSKPKKEGEQPKRRYQ